MRRLLLTLLVLLTPSCVTKTVVIEIKGEDNTINLIQKGSDGNTSELEIPFVGG